MLLLLWNICDVVKSVYFINLMSLLHLFILEYDKAILCEFKVEKDLCFPLVPPGAALDEMIFDTTELVSRGSRNKTELIPPS